MILKETFDNDTRNKYKALWNYVDHIFDLAAKCDEIFAGIETVYTTVEDFCQENDIKEIPFLYKNIFYTRPAYLTQNKIARYMKNEWNDRFPEKLQCPTQDKNDVTLMRYKKFLEKNNEEYALDYLELYLDDRYQELLQIIRRNYTYKTEESKFDGIHDIPQPFLNQLIELTKYIDPICATNDLENPYMEPMVLQGIIHSKYDTVEFRSFLEKNNISYMLKSKDLAETPFSINTKRFITPDWSYRKIVQDMLSRWWFNKELDGSRGYKIFIEFRDNFPYGYLQGEIRNHMKESNGDFLEVYSKLSEDDFKLFGDIIKYFQDKNIRRYSDEPKLKTRLLDYQKEFKPEIESGEFVHFEFANYYNPMDRNLYSLLADYFSELE